MIPSLTHLDTFRLAIVHGSFTQAARELGVSQPAVSYRIDTLEEQLGQWLFERPRRPLILTAAGARLHEFCERFLSELEVTATAIAEGGWDVEEPVRIATAGAFGRFVVFPILLDPAFRDLPVHLLFRQPEDIVDLVESGQCEVGIVYEPLVTHTLELREVCVEEFVLITSPDSALDAEAVDLQALESVDFVSYEECDYVFGRWFDRVFEAQPRRLRTVSHFERIEEVLTMVALGRGVSIVPEHAVRSAPDGTGVRIIRPGGRQAFNSELAVTRPGRVMRPEVAEILRRVAASSVDAGHLPQLRTT